MLRLMDKKDWMRTIADMGSLESVWYEQISASTDNMSFLLSPNDLGGVLCV